MAGGLLRQPDFLKLWLGETVSQIGSTVSRDALPLTAVLTLGAAPIQLGLLGAVGSTPALVLGLFAGVWADRLPRRPLMILADLGRAALLGTIPLAAAFGVLHVELLYVVALLAGVLTVFFDVAYRSFVPSLVRSDQLLDANGRLGASESIAEFTGAPLAGILVQAVTGPIAILIDALSFVWSAACLGLIRAPGPDAPGEPRRSLRAEIGEGLQTVWRLQVLRAPAVALMFIALFGNIIGATYYLYALRTLGLGPALLGLVIACGGLGALPGSLLAAPAGRRFGTGPTLIVTALAGSVVTLLIPLARGPIFLSVTLLALNQFAGDLLRSIYMANDLSLRQVAAPPALLGRVNGTVHVMGQGVTPIGLALGGALAQWLGLRPALVVACAGGVLAGVWLAASPVRHVRQLAAGPPAAWTAGP